MTETEVNERLKELVTSHSGLHVTAEGETVTHEGRYRIRAGRSVRQAQTVWDDIPWTDDAAADLAAVADAVHANRGDHTGTLYVEAWRTGATHACGRVSVPCTGDTAALTTTRPTTPAEGMGAVMGASERMTAQLLDALAERDRRIHLAYEQIQALSVALVEARYHAAAAEQATDASAMLEALREIRPTLDALAPAVLAAMAAHAQRSAPAPAPAPARTDDTPDPHQLANALVATLTDAGAQLVTVAREAPGALTAHHRAALVALATDLHPLITAAQ